MLSPAILTLFDYVVQLLPPVDDIQLLLFHKINLCRYINTRSQQDGQHTQTHVKLSSVGLDGSHTTFQLGPGLHQVCVNKRT